MWLINTTSLALEFIEDPETCIYAILSHTWGDGEVSFQDMADINRARKKQGFSKIERTCQLACDRTIEYAWVDTCCIDKSSSAELTEAINSMFRWYKQSHVCFVFLSDLLSINKNFMSNYLPNCRWFTRGWTLQELIAPEEIEFYDSGWDLIGTNVSLRGLLSDITKISAEILTDSDMLQTIPVARRMSWAASRQTTRIEDLAYCLFGIFDVNLPLIYGEGQKAFIRLQEAIARENNDLSLFAWTSQNEDAFPFHRRREFRGILAESPAEFKECSHLQNISDPGVLPAQVSITDQGFNITDRLSDGEQDYLLNLDCTINKPKETIVVRLVRTAHGYARHQFHRHASSGHHLLRKSAMSTLPIPKTISPAESKLIKLRLKHRFSFDLGIDLASFKYSLLRKPQHLWDSATKTLITDGYEAFTGIIEIKTFADAISIPGAPSGYTLDGSRFVIFGLKTIQVLNDSLEKTLSPWAGIYSTQGNGRPILSHIVSLEETHGFPHVARRAREFVLEQDSRKLPRISEEIAVSRDQLDFGRKRSRADRTVKFVLSMEVEETSDVSIYKMEVNVGWKDEVDGHESVQHRSVA